MRHTTLPTRRIWYGDPYEIPADALSDEPTHDEDPSSLRAEASRDDICYLRLLQDFHDGTYLARVAAYPTFFSATEGYTAVLTDKQLAQARPWQRNDAHSCAVGARLLIGSLERVSRRALLA